jgi:uncharacterized protein DUF4345
MPPLRGSIWMRFARNLDGSAYPRDRRGAVFAVPGAKIAPMLMELALTILLGLFALICLLGGLNLLTKGAGAFLPETLPPQRTLDNLFRFLSGTYFGFGFLMTWVVFNIHELRGLIYCFQAGFECLRVRMESLGRRELNRGQTPFLPAVWTAGEELI